MLWRQHGRMLHLPARTAALKPQGHDPSHGHVENGGCGLNGPEEAEVRLEVTLAIKVDSQDRNMVVHNTVVRLLLTL